MTRYFSIVIEAHALKGGVADRNFSITTDYYSLPSCLLTDRKRDLSWMFYSGFRQTKQLLSLRRWVLTIIPSQIP